MKMKKTEPRYSAPGNYSQCCILTDSDFKSRQHRILLRNESPLNPEEICILINPNAHYKHRWICIYFPRYSILKEVDFELDHLN